MNTKIAKRNIFNFAVFPTRHYKGGLNEKNRVSGLKDLNRLLSEIQKRWPDVEFMTSSQLGDLISK